MTNNFQVFIRCNAGTHIGIGHLARMYHLAVQLDKLGKKSTFLVDQITDACLPFFQTFPAIELYPNGKFTNQIDDADRCISYLTDHSEIIISDDYRLGEEWEKQISSQHQQLKLVAVDDLADRNHQCDILIDQKWRGDDTEKAYKGLVPNTCTTLLGPKYSLLSSAYIDLQRQSKGTTQTFRVMLSLGGGGDLALLSPLIETLLTTFSETPIEIWPVIGPMAENKQVIQQLATQHNNILPIEGKNDLSSFYAQSDLFIGAAGTSIYELASLNLPCITFSLAPNQQNKSTDLDDLGLYFHLSFEEFQQTTELARLVKTVHSHYTRVEALFKDSPIKIDGYGCVRIARTILGLEESSSGSTKPSLLETETQALKPGVSISKVSDHHINRYRLARNLPQNCENMTERDEIPKLSHYNWWFTNTRENYVLTQNDQPQLYIWHQVKKYRDKPYLIGGWFVCGKECTFDIAALVLKWQLTETATHYPEIPWSAVIKKSNQYVNLLNKYMGFTEIPQAAEAFAATSSFFPNASVDEYNYVQYRAGSSQEDSDNA